MATARNAFLINIARPDLAPSNVFVVAEGAVRVSGTGMASGEYVEIEKQVSPAAGSFAAVWAPLIRQGQAVRLSQNNIEHIELISGIYRAVYAGAENVVVYMAEDQSLLDARMQYTYPAYNPGFNGSVTGTGLSPALVSSRDRAGHWMYDLIQKAYIWCEGVLDTSTGTVVYTYWNAPGGQEISPSRPIQQPLDYPSCERVFVFSITGVGGEPPEPYFDIASVIAGYAIKKLTILVDSGTFTLTDSNTNAITLYAGESYSWEVTSSMGQLENADLGNLRLDPLDGAGSAARILVQACHISPLCDTFFPLFGE